MRAPTEVNTDSFELSCESSSDPSQVPYSGIGGSGWTSLGHAIVLDSPLLVTEILNAMPSLWREVASERALAAAVRYESMKILNWFEKQHFLSIWKRLEDSVFRCGVWALNEAFKWNRPNLVTWLVERGFTLPIGQDHHGNPVLSALNSDCLPLLQYALKLIESRPTPQNPSKDTVIRQGSDDGEDDEGRDKLVSLRDIRTRALLLGASECWKYLMSLDDVVGASDSEFLELVDWDQYCRSRIEDRNTKGMDFGKDMLKKYDSLVNQLRLARKNKKSSAPKKSNGKRPQRQTTIEEEDEDAPKTIAEHLVENIRHDSYMDVFPEDGEIPVIQWFLDNEFITMNGSDTSPSLAAALMDAVQLFQFDHNDEDSDDDDDDNDDYDDDVDEEDGETSDEDEDIQESLSLISWLYKRGADLKAIKGMKENQNGKESADISELMQSWPHKKKYQAAVAKITSNPP
jgi:hypothetical protein